MTKGDPDQDDRTLVAQVLAHEARADAAFRALYDRHADEVFGFLVRLLGDRGLAEDVLQEAFFRAYKALERFDPARSFRAWVFQIARNAATDLVRTRRKEQRLAEASARLAPPEVPGDAAVLEAERREESSRAREALEALPEEARALLIQRHGLGMKLEELAESWSVSERTVRTRLRDAAALLAQAIAAATGRAVDDGEGETA